MKGRNIMTDEGGMTLVLVRNHGTVVCVLFVFFFRCGGKGLRR